MWLLLQIVLLIILSACSHKDKSALLIPNTEAIFITSKENSVPYKLFIGLPEGYNSKGHHSYRENYPVLYLLDPDIEFGIVENIARTMVNYDIIEPFIIVGIGYQDQDLATMNSKTFWDSWTHNRARDYIPIRVSEDVKRFEGGDHEYKGLACHTGGSKKFKDFIEKELIPYIDHSYRTSNERILAGHSQAGLFTTWMMLNCNGTFQKYIVLSPSLWVEKGQIINQANKFQCPTEMKVYFAAGSLEHDIRGNMINDLKSLYASLPKSKRFKSKIEIIEDENHVSMIPAALTKSFKYLFGK